MMDRDDCPPIRSKPLVRCCECGSGLIYPVQVQTLEDGRCVVGRRCPECEHRDVVECSANAALAWLARELELRRRLFAAVRQAALTNG